MLIALESPEFLPRSGCAKGFNNVQPCTRARFTAARAHRPAARLVFLRSSRATRSLGARFGGLADLERCEQASWYGCLGGIGDVFSQGLRAADVLWLIITRSLIKLIGLIKQVWWRLGALLAVLGLFGSFSFFGFFRFFLFFLRHLISQLLCRRKLGGAWRQN